MKSCPTTCSWIFYFFLPFPYDSLSLHCSHVYSADIISWDFSLLLLLPSSPQLPLFGMLHSWFSKDLCSCMSLFRCFSSLSRILVAARILWELPQKEELFMPNICGFICCKWSLSWRKCLSFSWFVSFTVQERIKRFSLQNSVLFCQCNLSTLYLQDLSLMLNIVRRLCTVRYLQNCVPIRWVSIVIIAIHLCCGPLCGLVAGRTSVRVLHHIPLPGGRFCPRVAHGGGRFFLLLCGAVGSYSLAGWLPSMLFRGVMWQPGAVSGVMSDWRVISDSNKQIA